MDGLAHSQGSGSDEQDTCSAASGYAFVFFVSFRTEKNLLGTLVSAPRDEREGKTWTCACSKGVCRKLQT